MTASPPPRKSYRRVMIIGGPGSGKSTLAREIGSIWALPVHHLDAYFWRPGWVESDRAEMAARLRAIYAEEAWVVDGNYSLTWPERVARAELVIWLDISTPIRLWRLVWRTLRNYGRTRSDLGEDCPERFDFDFFWYAAWTAPRSTRPKAAALMASLPEGVDGVHLTRPHEVRRWLDGLAAVQSC